MKFDRTYLFIALSTIALAIVLVIQVNWMLEAAQLKKELFGEKANLVLTKTAEALSSDTSTRKKMDVRVGSNEIHKIDSLFKHYMQVYNIRIHYYFDVKSEPVATMTNSPFTKAAPQPGCYQTCVKDGERAVGLKLVFPDEEQFIMEEMSIPFFTSIALIILVLVMSWRTITSLIREKNISEHTTEFLNNMTHEFKTPLTNIALAGKMISKENNLSEKEKIKHYSGIILAENEKLCLQVEQVLSMTALERGEIPIQKTEVDLHGLIEHALKSISVQLEDKKACVTLNLEADKRVIIGDKTHMVNAVSNLIDNAIKYSDGKPELIISTRNQEDKIILEIKDHGIGIEDRYHGKVFDKFFRVPTGNVHNVKGFGLGLAYVKKIIALHNGTIELFSAKGKGTTFLISLPNA